jgi:hypothetical protein
MDELPPDVKRIRGLAHDKDGDIYTGLCPNCNYIHCAIEINGIRVEFKLDDQEAATWAEHLIEMVKRNQTKGTVQ